MTYALLLQLLIEAEQRRDDESLPQDVRDRSIETVSLCKQRMASEGITRHQLEQLAAA
ncbi:hypothetical protein [Metapseudomonas otitidis]|uniref:hypothetical protein n=1 Tax=Metapseudomonas otitidis TaxID=319939 RepID=UPI0028116034|nr:hypothetical protein [Pseudomonas otitidis]WMR34737.1 hypothetical protein QT513_08365 [Pseudomonas otitidis]